MTDKQPTPPTDMKLLGLAFIRFGTAMVDGDTQMSDLGVLASECGLSISFGLDVIANPKPDKPPVNNADAPGELNTDGYDASDLLARITVARKPTE